MQAAGAVAQQLPQQGPRPVLVAGTEGGWARSDPAGAGPWRGHSRGWWQRPVLEVHLLDEDAAQTIEPIDPRVRAPLWHPGMGQ